MRSSSTVELKRPILGGNPLQQPKNKAIEMKSTTTCSLLLAVAATTMIVAATPLRASETDDRIESSFEKTYPNFRTPKKHMLTIKDLSAMVAQRPLHIFLKIVVRVGNFVKSIPSVL